MSRKVSATEMKNRFGSLTDRVVETQDVLIVEVRGTPKVAVISFEEYQKLQGCREEIRRRALLARFKALREEIRSRNRDLTEKEAEALAERLIRATVERMIADGTISYKGR